VNTPILRGAQRRVFGPDGQKAHAVAELPGDAVGPGLELTPGHSKRWSLCRTARRQVLNLTLYSALWV